MGLEFIQIDSKESFIAAVYPTWGDLGPYKIAKMTSRQKRLMINRHLARILLYPEICKHKPDFFSLFDACLTNLKQLEDLEPEYKIGNRAAWNRAVRYGAEDLVKIIMGSSGDIEENRWFTLYTCSANGRPAPGNGGIDPKLVWPVTDDADLNLKIS